MSASAKNSKRLFFGEANNRDLEAFYNGDFKLGTKSPLLFIFTCKVAMFLKTVKFAWEHWIENCMHLEDYEVHRVSQKIGA